MNYIQEDFEKRTGLSHKNPECRYELTIFRKGVESGRFYEVERIEALRNKIERLSQIILNHDTNHTYKCENLTTELLKGR